MHKVGESSVLELLHLRSLALYGEAGFCSGRTLFPFDSCPPRPSRLSLSCCRRPFNRNYYLAVFLKVTEASLLVWRLSKSEHMSKPTRLGAGTLPCARELLKVEDSGIFSAARAGVNTLSLKLKCFYTAQTTS